MCVRVCAFLIQFYLAGFGPPAPLDEARLVWAEPRDACGSLSNADTLSGAIVLAERGRCSFVDKVRMCAKPEKNVSISRAARKRRLKKNFSRSSRTAVLWIVDVQSTLRSALGLRSSPLKRQANTVAGRSALALVLINSGADGEDLFRVAATLGGSSEGKEPQGPENMPTVSSFSRHG